MAKKGSIGNKYLLGMAIGDKRLMGLSSGDILLYQEIYKQVVGTDLVITDTKRDKGKITGFSCNSSQAKSLLGSNLLDTIKMVQTNRTVDELTITKQSNDTYKITGTKTGAGWTQFNSSTSPYKIYLKAGVSYWSSVNLSCYKASTGTWDSNKLGLFTPTEDLYFTWWYFATNVVKTYNDTIYPMLLQSTTSVTNQPATYTQFVPNKPSFEYPSMPLNSGDGGYIKLWSHKKNRLKSTDFDVFSSNGGNTYDITNKIITLTGTPPASVAGRYKFFAVTPGKRYYFSVYVRTNRVFNIKVGLESSAGVIASNTEYTRITTTLIASSNAVAVIIYHMSGGQTGDWIQFKDWQLEEDTLSLYEDYVGVEPQIQLPVNYIGGSLPNGSKSTDTQEPMAKVVLNGSENWNSVSQSTGNADYYYCYSSLLDGLVKDKANSTIINEICDKLTVVPNLTTSVVVASESVSVQYVSTLKLRAMILKSRINAMSGANLIEKWKALLASNPVTLYYQRVSPLPVDIPDTEVDTYADYNVITTTNAVKVDLIFDYLEKG